jgi:enoyl-CoA hydratase
MSAQCVFLEQHGPITVIRLNRPPANAFSLELGREFEAAFDASAVNEARALVLTGTGHFFSGGLDLKVVPTYSREEQGDFLRILNRAIGRLYACPIPVVAAINGHAIAGAFVLALATDYRVGPAGTAQFGLTEARVGIPFPAVPMIVLHAELAPQDVRYTTLYARNFGPDEAYRRGVLDELQPPEAVVERAIEVACDMASMPADSYRRVKQQVRRVALAQIEDAVSRDADPMLAGWLSPEARSASATVLAGSGVR